MEVAAPGDVSAERDEPLAELEHAEIVNARTASKPVATRVRVQAGLTRSKYGKADRRRIRATTQLC
ncbi:MAG: hypothetical protein ABIZ69_12135, partial [Ilumatobacteraceae bacterium]